MKNIRTTSSILLCCILLGAGCGTTKNKAREVDFYPPAPEQPRLQFLTSYSVPSDLSPPSSAFQKFVLGEENAKPEPGINKPYGLAVQGSKLYVCDTIGRLVHILDLENRNWDYFRSSEMGTPFNIAVDLDGSRYITDPTRKMVQIYNSAGQTLGALRDERISKPTGIALSGDRIYVGDIDNHQAHVFDKATRELQFSIPRNPDNEDEQLYSPTNITLDQDGNIYISDMGGFHVKKFDPEGNHLRTVGSHGTAPGTFARNKGIAVDRTGNLYVVDAAFQNIQIFNSEGELLLYFGAPGGCLYPMALPANVFIDYENTALFQKYAAPGFELEYLLFVSNQYGARKVAVYGFGHMAQP